MVQVVVNQGLLGSVDRALDGLKLLNNIDTRSTADEHRDDILQVTIGALEAIDNLGMTGMWGGHLRFLILPGGYIAEREYRR